MDIKRKSPTNVEDFTLWEHTGSNRGPSRCKRDALNQLSYAPLRSANLRGYFQFPKKKLN